MPIPAGTRLGPYEVLSAIGAGGMGEVYRAHDSKLGRDVALKVLPAAFTAHSERMARFEREARLLAALNHPNIAHIYGLEESSGTPALVMELVEGPTLAERIAAGPIPVDEALPIARQIAEAVEYAHEKGVIHRDLKPANIKVKADGTVKVLDFGLAKALTEDPAAVDMSNSPTLSMGATVQGVILGTAAYMSPEQAKAKPVDRRADIWAFGVVLYEMLTGKKLYSGETAAETLAAVIMKEPPLETLPPSVPPSIVNLLRRCLDKDSHQRLRDIGEARIMIEHAGASPAPADLVAGQGRSRERIVLAAAAAFAIVASVAFGAVLLLQKPNAALPLQAVILPPKDRSFYGPYLAVSPDGKKISFVATDSANGNRMIWVRPIDSMAAQPLAGTGGALNVFWSPDSKSIAFVPEASRGLKKIDAGGGPVFTLTDAEPSSKGTWGRDGTIVFPRIGYGLYEVSSDGGPVSQLTQLDEKRGETEHRWPFFLPDGRHLLFQSTVSDASPGGSSYEIRVLDLKTRSQKTLLRADSNAEYANGHLIYVQQGNLMAQPFDLSSLTVSGDPVPVAQEVGQPGTGVASFGAFDASPSGVLAFASGTAETRRLVWYTRDGKETGQVGGSGGFSGVSLSPDGTKAATSLGQGATRDIFVFELARGLASRLTVDGRGADHPLWSRDGATVMYWDRERGSGFYTKPVNALSGSELVEHLTEVGRNAAAPNSISPDGKLLVYMSFVNGPFPHLWVHPLAVEKPDAKDYALLGTNFAEGHAQFSPDGHWLAYMAEETATRGEVYVVPFPALSSKMQISTSGGSQPRWRRDGKEIYYVAPDGKMMAVTVAVSGNSLKPDPPEALFQTRIVNAVRGYQQYDVTSDGQKFLINSSLDQISQPITLYANWATALKEK